MDKVRLGRVLGFGARQAARTLMQAADAVAAPSPGDRARATDAAPASVAASRSTAQPSRGAVLTPTRVATQRSGGVAAGTKGFGKAVWNPLARYTSVLWLEVTGAFYAIFAMMLGTAAWRQRGAVYAAAASAGAGSSPHRFWMYAVLTALFAYFCATNFVRARSRQRR